MNCPTCNVPLVMSERQGIEIDYCPQCRGIWLDRGELDKIIERAALDLNSSNKTPEQTPTYNDPVYREPYQKYHKKKHWINDLFD
ncbi:MAG: zf-TFIIB domain-containing protein [Flavobacteriaceae bacterium]|jgi:Zn-finger nucleic acid-binding protein|nr:zf-TFIIB domain-containing protein [Flavobacteriaceae bacterium]